jgi:hypothetical protein
VKLGKPIAAGGQDWYVLADGRAVAIIEASKGIVTEIGIADKTLARTVAARKKLLASVA